MKYKSIFVPAQPATYTKQVLFSGTVMEESDVMIDGAALAQACEKACNDLDAEGYEVLSVTGTTRGRHFQEDGTMAAWSLTQGLIITARMKGAS